MSRKQIIFRVIIILIISLTLAIVFFFGLKTYQGHKNVELIDTGYIVLMAIEDDEKLNIKKLGERVFLDSGTLTPLLKKLEKKNYVVRSREEKDERNLQISLTEHGQDIKKILADISTKVYSEFNINQEEIKELIENLQNFVSCNFDKITEK